jgi:hypothetical protein
MDPPVPAEGIIAADREPANVNQAPRQDMGSQAATTTGNNIVPLNTNEVAVNINFVLEIEINLQTQNSKLFLLNPATKIHQFHF